MSKRRKTKARGYGAGHEALRRHWALRIKRAGSVPCARCQAPVYAAWHPDPPALHVVACKSRACQGACWWTWDLGHRDDRSGYQGPEHACCNRSAGARMRGKASQEVKHYGW